MLVKGSWWWRMVMPYIIATVYPKKYAHGFVVLCFVVVMQSFIMNSYEVFIHIHQSCFAGTGAIVRLPQCQWSKPDGYRKISQCITTTKHSKAKTVCIFLGIYCSCSRINISRLIQVSLTFADANHTLTPNAWKANLKIDYRQFERMTDIHVKNIPVSNQSQHHPTSLRTVSGQFGPACVNEGKQNIPRADN